MTIQEMRCTSPSEAAMLGSAVATIVWSTIARNIGSMIEGKTAKNRLRGDGGGSGGAWPGSDVVLGGCGAGAPPFSMRAGRGDLPLRGCGASDRRKSSA